jgi:hypothetical protein
MMNWAESRQYVPIQQGGFGPDANQRRLSVYARWVGYGRKVGGLFSFRGPLSMAVYAQLRPSAARAINP